MACIYLGESIKGSTHACSIHGQCDPVASDPKSNRRACSLCKDHASIDQLLADTSTFIDPLRITMSDGVTPTNHLRNFLKGGAAFLVCGGPSLKNLPLERLYERGIFSLGVNNVAGRVPCSAFVASDPPRKFHSSIFFDPKIIKLLPTPKLQKNRGKLRKKVGNEFIDLDDTTSNCPNVWGFERRSWLACDHTWFTDTAAAWGNHNSGVEQTGERKTVNTTFLGLRLLQYMGARYVFLLGVDFGMDPYKEAKDNYAFGETRNMEACITNNNQYAVSNDWLTRLRPVFESFGFYTFNCNPLSYLRSFDYVPFSEALEVVRGKVEIEPYDLSGWYGSGKVEVHKK